MPQVAGYAGSTRTGIATDPSYIIKPVGVHLDWKKGISREHRHHVQSLDNGLLQETRWNNNVWDNSKWKGNGFVGHVAYVPNSLRKSEIRPTHLDADLQFPTFPKECSRPLNTSQMGPDKIPLDASTSGTAENVKKHRDIIQSHRHHWAQACLHEKNAAHFNYFDWQAESLKNKERLKQEWHNVKNIRAAGMGSINPAIGTAGQLPDLTNIRGKEGLDSWRTISPTMTGNNFLLQHVPARKYYQNENRRWANPGEGYT